MARAKRTDRAEARRRSRALGGSLVDSDGSPGDDETIESTPVTRATSATGRRGGSAAAGPATASAQIERPSLIRSFRGAFRPLDVRGDLRALPQLVTHWSFYVPVILSGLAVVLFQYLPNDRLVFAYFGYFAGITPLGAVMLAGFFAPRASWLVGALVSVVGASLLVLSANVQYGGLPDGSYFQVWLPQPGLVDATVAKAQIPSALFDAVAGGASFGGLFAAVAAWYRRFLKSASPARTRPVAGGGRRPDGKVPKKQQPRPMLARRR